ncbi:3-deoxy-D-manno-octulosonic acid transferase [Pelagovum pacificum]|uniref:3-deoxy-D-manno-octulosonic acid transferase n=1 Tax=Pelagovum pacificum TaxID=2588711 RepID=UPI0018CE748F|nr:glycosyltransferase N-terminal domain-containing protein [Pelagovum pacificum]QQA41580.1 3-deoxy-D-manno-octulosonic acid transferase [Pelagovum pacificum]
MFVYRLILSIALPFLAISALFRWLSGKEDRNAFRDRLFGAPVPTGAIWIHGASVGELTSARKLIMAILKDREARIIVTTNTVTGRDMVESWKLPRVRARIAPIDARDTLTPMISRAAALVVLENEIWPNRIALAHKAGIPVLMIGARMSELSFQRWKNRPNLMRSLLEPVTLLVPQDSESGDRFRQLGAPARAMAAPVQLKSLYRPEGQTDDRLSFSRAHTVLAASTHEGEENIVFEAFNRARKSEPKLRLILAPRHPERAGDIARRAARLGLQAALRSTSGPPQKPVYIADTMGELELFYGMAGVAFVGGSLVEKGGHTPYEPAALGCAILHGPHVANFGSEYAVLDKAGGAELVTDAESLAAAWLRHRDGSPMPAIAAKKLMPVETDEVFGRILSILTPRQTSARRGR